MYKNIFEVEYGNNQCNQIKVNPIKYPIIKIYYKRIRILVLKLLVDQIMMFNLNSKFFKDNILDDDFNNRKFTYIP